MISRGRFRYIRSLYRRPIRVNYTITDLSDIVHVPLKDGMPWVMLTTEKGPEPTPEVDLNDWVIDLPVGLETMKHGLPDIDITRTYPTTIEVLDEVNFDRLVMDMAKGGYYEGQRKLDSEFDYEVITKVSPDSRYLTLKRAKDRPVIDSDQYFRAADHAAQIMVDNMTSLHGDTVELVGGVWQRKRADDRNPLAGLHPVDITVGGRDDRRMGKPGESHQRDSDPIDGGYVPPSAVIYLG